MRMILLIDMDYFYVACEELRRPEIRGKPAVVGADPMEGRGRGVVMTCNYPARKFGIRSGMPISMAYRLNPDAIYLPTDFNYYEEVSRKVMAIIKGFADKFEQVSVDEAYIDISRKAAGYSEAVEYARKIKDEIKSAVGIPCSIGIGTNKLVAKMACEAAKPDGIKLVKEDEAVGFLGALPVGKLYGIGKKTEERLQAMGLKQVSDLAKSSPMELMERFGTFGIEMHKYANALDESRVEENYEVKSIGRETTFYDSTQSGEVVEAIRRLSNEVIEEVKKQGLSFKVVTLKLRYADFSEHLKSRSMPNSNNVNDIINTATELYFKNTDKQKRLRKIGVRVSGLVKYKGQKKIGEYA